MISTHRAAMCVLLLLPLAVQAQQSRPSPDPADANVPVPPLVYASVTSSHRQVALDDQATPDKAWRAANDALAGESAHAGHESAPAPADHSKHH